VNGKVPSRRDKQCCCAVGSKIYFFGGFGPQEPEPEEQSEKTAQSGEAKKQGTSGNEETAEQEEEEEGPCATFGWFNDLFVLDTGKNTFASQATMLTHLICRYYDLATADYTRDTTNGACGFCTRREEQQVVRIWRPR